MKTIDTLTAFESTINRSKITCIIFSSDVCPDCDYLFSFFHLVKAQYPTIDFQKVKRHVLSELFDHYKVIGVPSLILYKAGHIIGRYVDKERKTLADIIAFIEETIMEGGECKCFSDVKER